MPASSLKVAVALVKRLSPHLPPGVGATAGIGSVDVTVDGEQRAGSAALRILDDQVQRAISDPDELLERVVRSALSGVQDAVSEARAVEWPSGGAVGDAVVRDGHLRIWFGRESDPVVQLDPIPMVELD